MTDIQTLKAQHDIIQIIRRTVQLKKRGQRYVGLCPFHIDTNPSLVVYPSKQSFHCFGCGESGDVISWIEKSVGVDFKAAIKLLGNLPESELQPLFKPQFKRFRTISQKAAEYWHSKLGKRRTYYHNRGFADVTVDRELWGWDGRRFVVTIWEGKPQASKLLAVKLRRDDVGEKQRLADNGLTGDQLDNALRLIPRYLLRGSYQPILYNKWAVENKEDVWIFFGEFDAALAYQLGLNACSPVHGANSWQQSWSDTTLRFARKVFVVPDRCERSQGFDAKAKIGGHTRIIELPEGPWKDFTDYILAGNYPERLRNDSTGYS